MPLAGIPWGRPPEDMEPPAPSWLFHFHALWLYGPAVGTTAAGARSVPVLLAINDAKPGWRTIGPTNTTQPPNYDHPNARDKQQPNDRRRSGRDNSAGFALVRRVSFRPITRAATDRHTRQPTNPIPPKS